MRGTVFLRAEAMTSLLLSGGGAGRSVGRGGVIGCKPAAPRTNPQARYYQPSPSLSEETCISHKTIAVVGIIKHECCQHRSGHDISLQFVYSCLLRF